jgi:light-regulated signal transduction histidine kinase (bacteriophytochrome)
MSEKEQATEAILRAQAELEQALRELEKMPAIDPGAIAFSAHALNNYLSVIGGTVEFLLGSLVNHPDPQIRNWLEGLRHVTELMGHTVSQLMTSSAPKDAKLRFLKWDLAPLVRRTGKISSLFVSPPATSLRYGPILWLSLLYWTISSQTPSSILFLEKRFGCSCGRR